MPPSRSPDTAPCTRSSICDTGDLTSRFSDGAGPLPLRYPGLEETDLNVNLFALTCGRLTGDLGYLIVGGGGSAELAFRAYLVELPKGTVLFDTGMHPYCQHNPATRVGARIAGLFSFDYRPGE